MTNYEYTRAGEVDMPRTGTLLALAFGGEDEDCIKWLQKSGIENLRVMRRDAGGDKDIVGTVLRIEMGQYFGGASVPMMGIAAVSAAPEARGAGVATEMMKACVRELHAEGWPISTLYPSTQPLYRKIGYEVTGHRFEYTVPLGKLGQNISEVKGWSIRPLDDRDFGTMKEMYLTFARVWPGMVDRSDYLWNRIRSWRGLTYRPFGAYSPEGELCGYVLMSQSRKPETGRFNIVISDIAWTTPDAVRRIVMFLADFTTMGDDLIVNGGPSHPLFAYIHHNIYQMRLRDPWMLRITHLEKAIAARPYHSWVNVAATLRIQDDVVPGHCGSWRITIAEGKGRAEPGDSGDHASEIDIQTLAQIWSGYLSVDQALAMGRVKGDVAEAVRLAPAFAGSTPWMTDFF